MRPLELDEVEMLLQRRQQRRGRPAERNSTQQCESILLEALAVEVFILRDEDTAGSERCHSDHRIGRVRWNGEALALYTMPATLQEAADRIRHVVVEEKTKFDRRLRH